MKVKTIKTFARLRTKFGGSIEENIFIPSNLSGNGWEFVSKIDGLPKELFNRYSMIYFK